MSENTNFDVDGQIEAVTRGLESRDRDGRPTLVSIIGQRYDTSVEDLWEACTSPERLPRWFAPVSGDLRPGGKYQVEGNAGGVVETCEAPRFFSATWEYEGNVSWITVRVDPEGDGARLTLEHTAHSDTMVEFWERFGPGATGVGWDLALMGLARHLASASTTPPEAQGWERTEEGRRFITGSSRAWAETNVALGTSRADAEGARERTTAFYLGEEPQAR